MTNSNGRTWSSGCCQATALEAKADKPDGSWYRLPAEDGSDEGRLFYDSARNTIEMSLPGGVATIPGKYIMGIQSALNRLLDAEK